MDDEYNDVFDWSGRAAQQKIKEPETLSDATNDASQQKIREMQEEIQSLRDKISELKEDNQGLRAAGQASEQTIKELKGDILRLRAAKTVLKTKVAEGDHYREQHSLGIRMATALAARYPLNLSADNEGPEDLAFPQNDNGTDERGFTPWWSRVAECIDYSSEKDDTFSNIKDLLESVLYNMGSKPPTPSTLHQLVSMVHGLSVADRASNRWAQQWRAVTDENRNLSNRLEMASEFRQDIADRLAREQEEQADNE